MPKHGYDDVTCAKLDIADYIVGYYCQVRPHSFNDYLTPVEKEKQFFNQNRNHLTIPYCGGCQT